MDINALKEAIDLHDLFEKLGLEKGRSGNYKAPWRTDERPSISIYDGGRKWKDHGDSTKAGSAIDIVMEVMEMDVPAAMRYLHDLYGFPKSTANTVEVSQSQPKASYLWRVVSCHKGIEQAVDYLVNERKLPRDFVEKYSGKLFGFSDYHPPNNPSDPSHGPAVAFPCGFPGQPPAVLNLRYLESEHEPKVRHIGGDATGVLFAASDWSRIKKASIVWWVEAPIDALTLAAAGCPAVSFLSASNANSVVLDWMRPNQLLRLWGDKDSAGNSAVRKLYHRAIDAGLTPQCVDVKNFKWKDPNDGLQNGMSLEDINHIAQEVSTKLFPVGLIYLPEYEFIAQSAVRAHLDSMEIETRKKEDDGDEKTKVIQISGFRVYRLDLLRIHDSSSVFGIQDEYLSPEIRTLVHYRRVDSNVIQRSVIFGTDIGKLSAWQNFGWIHSQTHLLRITQILARDVHSTSDDVQVVGLVKVNGEYFLQNGPDTYLNNRECIYHDLVIPSAPQEFSSKIIIDLDLMLKNHLAVIIFSWALGALLKVYLGYWPHLFAPAPTGAGKTTLLDNIKKLTGATVTENSELESGCAVCV